MNTNIQTKPSGRITWLDLAKGIGILLVVWAHAKGPFSGAIYQFHMPFFFLISGLLYNEKDSLPVFTRKRFLSLYVPFVFWNALACLVRWFTQYRPCSWSSIRSRLKLILLTLDKDPYLFGATWFLGALFVYTVLYKLVDVLLKRLHAPRLLLTGLSVLVGALAFVIPLPYTVNRTLVLGLFYGVGDLVRVYQEPLKRFANGWLSLGSFLIFAWIASFNRANMGKNSYSSPVLFVLGALLMSYALCWLCWRVDQWHSPRIWECCRLWLIRFGKHSMDLLIWQFVFFRVITIIQILRWHMPLMNTLLEHQPTFVTGKIWWFLYFLAGSFLPLLFTDFLRWGPWGKVLKKLHLV